MKPALTASVLSLAFLSSPALSDEHPPVDPGKFVAPPRAIPMFAIASIDWKQGMLIARRSRIRIMDVEEEYVVTVPVAELVDGERVIRERKEKRVRRKKVPQHVNFVECHQIASLVFRAVDETELTAEQAAEFMKSPKPVLMLPQGEELDPYFRQILKRKTLVVYGPGVRR